MTRRLGLIMRSDLLLRSLLILADLIVIIGDFVNVEGLTHAFSSRHATLVVRHRTRSNIET